ncbi:hypothetical protein L249_4260, partial [Ophiocordyceps polyrhachis-furcata BCC 54312]
NQEIEGSDDDSPKGPGLLNVTLLREVPSYTDGKENGKALQIRGCFAGSEGIADLAVAYKDYINPCVSP